VLAQLRRKLLLWKEQLLPKHPMAEAVNYALSQWTELNVFCSDGAVAIDNNASKREMKRVVLNRKNSLFVGNPHGGCTAAILASLTSTCRRHNVDPQKSTRTSANGIHPRRRFLINRIELRRVLCNSY
jgi:hypothetical protein